MPVTQTNPFDLTGKRVVVTGGNAGIGLGMARALAAAGADIAIWGRRQTANQIACTELAESRGRTIGIECDVADEDSVHAATVRTIDELGQIDGCVASAGVASAHHAVQDFPSAEWRRVLAVDLDGTFHVMRSIARALIDGQAGGSLVAVSSVSSIHGHPYAAPYAASKTAVPGLMRSIAVELARHQIRANAVLPGWIETEMIADVTTSERVSDTVLHRIPLRRWGQPADLGGLAVYLMSDAARYHTGDTLRVDGGYAIF